MTAGAAGARPAVHGLLRGPPRYPYTAEGADVRRAAAGADRPDGLPERGRGATWWYVATVRWPGVSGSGGSRAATRAPVAGTTTRRRFRTVRHEQAPGGES
ncbi:hypothetical protein GCM10023100_03330 [Actinocorallia cavernae]|uniref:Uncharacterized protein n=2 Tax=Actinomycetes TaxID=1760 RepID=A0ABP8S745_9ACTN